MSVFVSVLLAVVLTASACVGQQQSYNGPFIVGTTPQDALPEASGMAPSSEPGILWMMNDSGDGPNVYAVDVRRGLVAKHTLEGATNVDWEDMASRKGELFLADIGDNSAKRKSISVYRIAEPPTGSSTTITSAQVTKLELMYPDGARDAEAILIDPLSEELVIVTKREAHSRVYSASSLSAPMQTLVYRGELPMMLVTAGSVSSDGRHILLKNYHKAWEWKRDSNEPLWKALLRQGSRVPYAPEQQGEAICYDQGNQGYYTTSEREDGGSAAPIQYYPLVKGASAVGHDLKLPQIEATKVTDGNKKYLLRYTIPELLRVEITLHNEGMFKVMTIAEDSAESGVQERELDLSKFPTGSYAVLLKTQHSQASCLIEIP